MGLTQTTLARLSGLSRATVNQVENGTIKDLSLTRAVRLLSVLGLSVTVSAPHARNFQSTRARSCAFDLAARTASVSFREPMSASQLRDVFAFPDDAVPADFWPHLYTLLDEAPVSLLASMVEQVHLELRMERTQAWKRMRSLAEQFKSSRDLWL